MSESFYKVILILSPALSAQTHQTLLVSCVPINRTAALVQRWAALKQSLVFAEQCVRTRARELAPHWPFMSELGSHEVCYR